MKEYLSVFSLRRLCKWQYLLVIILFFLGASSGIYFFYLGKKPPAYLTVPLSHGDLEYSVLASGSLQPIHMVEVGAQVSGQLKSLKVKLGQRVSQGQLLAEIDPELAINDLKIAQSDLESLRAQRRGIIAKLEFARNESQRQDALVAAGASSIKQQQQAHANRAGLEADLSGTEAAITKANYAIRQQQTRLAYTRISAPMAGDVLKIDTKEGQTVISAQQAPKILTLGDLTRMEVWAQVSEADVMHIKPGQRAYFTLLGQPDKRHYGFVREIFPTPEKINEAKFYNVLFTVDNPEGALHMGMTVQVGIILAETHNSLLIPSTALQHQDKDGRYRIRVLSPQSTPLERKVHIGLQGRTQAQVLDGLKSGDRIIVGSPEESMPSPSQGK